MSNELKNILYKGYKFGIVGILSTTFNYGIFVVLYKIISIHYIVSSVTGYGSGLLLGYLLNKNWTFSAQVISQKIILLSYISVYGVSLVSSQAFLLFLVEFLLFLVGTHPPIFPMDRTSTENQQNAINTHMFA